MAAPLLSLDNLKVAYGRIEAVRGISMEVRPGEFVGIIGSNGAGKTSTLRAIAGVLSPAAGKITFDGKDTTCLPSHAMVQHGIAMVPEGRQVFADQTVEDNLLLGAYLRIGKHDAAVREDIERVFGLFPVLRQRRLQLAGALSGGEQQMLAIGRGLLSRPKLLIIDELSLGLAPKVLDLLFPVLLDLNREGLAILLVEQMASYALGVTHRTYVMENGRILVEGDSGSLASDPRVIDAYLGRRGAH